MKSVAQELKARGVTANEVIGRIVETGSRYRAMDYYGFKQTTSWANYCDSIGAPVGSGVNHPTVDANETLLDQVITKITKLQTELSEAQRLLKAQEQQISHLEAQLKSRNTPKLNLIRELVSDVIPERQAYYSDDPLSIPMEI